MSGATGSSVAPKVTLVEDVAVLGGDADVLALPIGPGEDGPVAGPGTAAAARALGIDLMAFAAREKATGAVGDLVAVPVVDGPVEQVLLVGTGGGGVTEMRRTGAALARRTKGKRLETTLSLGAPADRVRALVEGLLLASYGYDLRGGKPDKSAEAAAAARKKPAPSIVLHAKGAKAAAVGDAVSRGQRTAQAVCLARDLANTPSSGKTPAWLADQAVALGKKSGLEVKVWDEAALAAEGFGGLLAVGSGAAAKRGPRLIQMSYAPGGATPSEGAERSRTPHVVIVGKGITFDTGGLSLKPSDGMIAMKADMAGGAAVIGAMTALRDLGVQVRVTGLVAAAENMPSGSAFRPGDVITHYGGTTVEVLNTDAEGRLVLADALAYADAHLNPDYLIDLATLTGAATLALSRRIGALFTDDEKLASGLLAASEAGGDRLWRMPLTKDYRIALESPVADLAHVPHSKHRKINGGAITAALFLQEFVGNRRWAHVDMAGPGKIEGDDHENTKGGTGYGVRLLLRWLETLPKR
ncbi:MAG: leucyl aminopeptidase [Sporichthyaceae bacterium]